jgi:hypothetical protein
MSISELKVNEEKYQQKKDVLATKEDLANVKADIIKWMFIFWIGSVGVISGIMITLFNAYFKH